ncbi:MAG TPA: transposase, partial [Streptosporangiaceae bacterium]|nr:transposase [Streptosporangiaceae bacterium]
LKHREADVLRFLTDTAIPPTSNQAERDLRPAKTQQKISGRLRSGKTTATGTPSAATAPQPPSTGSRSLPRPRDALAGNPWIPPVPATT